MTLVLALRQAQQLALAAYPEALLIGPDVGSHGGPYHATLGLRAAHGSDRVIELPRNPTASFGIARGLALSGHRVVCELAREDGARMASALAQDIAAWSRLEEATVGASWGRPLAGQPPAPVGPIVLRVPVASDADLAPWLAAAGPGVHVVVPTTAEDAFMAVAGGVTADGGVVVVLEPESLYRRGEGAVPLAATLEAATIPSGPRPVTSAEGPSDLLLVAAGAGVAQAREVAAALVREGLRADVLDLRVLAPLDLDGLAARVAACGRTVLHVDAGSLGDRLSAALTARAFLSLEAPLRVVPVTAGAAGLLAVCRETAEF